MENKNGLNALLVPGAHLDEYIKAVAAQYRSDLTATYGTLQKAVALLEDMARGGYTPEKQQAVQHIAYVMMCYTTGKAWDYNRAKLDDAKEIGRRVKDLPLGKDLLAMMGDYGEVPTSAHVDGTPIEPGTVLTDAGAAKLAPLLAGLFKAALAAEERTQNNGNAGT